MKKEDCKISMKVNFGRPNGKRVLGKITELNPEKAMVKILESPISQHILVPYPWMEEETGEK